ncbi:MAG: sulfatase [bacterium]
MHHKSTMKIMIKKCLIFLLTIFFLYGCKNYIKSTFRDRPNIIIISVDTLRPDHLGCYGYKKDTSPNVDQFAEESLLFEKCFSHASFTGPSCASLLSGFLPHETKVILNYSIVQVDVPMLAEILKDSGFKTYGAVSNFILRKKQGFEQGFDMYDSQMDEAVLNEKYIYERIAEKTTDCVIRLLKQHTGGPFFLWVHYQDPHGPYTPQAPYNAMFHDLKDDPFDLEFNDTTSGKGGIPSYQKLQENHDYHYYVAQYDGEIRYFDEHFGRLVAFLKEIHQYDNSIIILTADHGEALGEHDYYFAHGHGLTNDLIHVPLFIRSGKTLKGKRKDFVQHLDIVPTILKTLQIKEPFVYRGRDLLTHPLQSTIISSELGSDHISGISEGMKLILDGDNTSLFDIQEDFYETQTLASNGTYKNILISMVNETKKLYKEDLLSLKIVEKMPSLTDTEKEKIRSLGYAEPGQ